jgi:UDP-glucose 4-epimerase
MKVFIAGGAGFIGSHFVDHFLGATDARVTVFDNFTSGRHWHLREHLGAPRLSVVEGDLQDLAALTAALRGHDIVYHFASNPDIAKAVTQPDIDFWQGTYLTQNLLEAMRRVGAPRLVYASGSGVYGDAGHAPAPEDFAPLRPISTYGASKLAGEALISAYGQMFGLQAWVFRFGNVVGRRQTHGVAYDMIEKLRRDPRSVEVLGDGRQSKPYIHVTDIVAAIAHVVRARSHVGFDCYNVATDDALDVKTIVELVIEAMGLRDVTLRFTGGSRGWAGDVPVVRLDLRRITALGWHPSLSSLDAMRRSIREMLGDDRP